MEGTGSWKAFSSYGFSSSDFQDIFQNFEDSDSKEEFSYDELCLLIPYGCKIGDCLQHSQNCLDTSTACLGVPGSLLASGLAFCLGSFRSFPQILERGKKMPSKTLPHLYQISTKSPMNFIWGMRARWPGVFYGCFGLRAHLASITSL